MGNFKVSKLVTYSCENGGSITISKTFDDLNKTGVDDSGAYFEDVYINAYSDLVMDVSRHDTTATLANTFNEDILDFQISAKSQSGKADIHFTGLRKESWYRLLFNGVLGRTKSGSTHGKSSEDGKLTFSEVLIPDE